MADETSTAGITISTEFMKNGRKPPQSMPVQAVDHAFAHASMFGDVGSDNRLPSRICAMSLSDVVSITYIGVRKNSANRNSTDQSAKRCHLGAVTGPSAARAGRLAGAAVTGTTGRGALISCSSVRNRDRALRWLRQSPA